MEQSNLVTQAQLLE